jgi:hydroxymethylpyrimidine pyrophosphatase-like HAD family hydrolase
MRCESEARTTLSPDATVARSNPRHFDVTHRLANKGAAVRAVAKWLEIPPAEIAVIGDGENDVAMFDQAGLSIAMGNAQADVQAHADFVTDTCNNEGFATAMHRYLIDTRGKTAG